MTDKSLSFRSRLIDAGIAADCDKFVRHAYHYAYAQALYALAERPSQHILEIGYGGGASLGLWRKLFPNSQVICIDIDHELEGEGFSVVRADQSDPSEILAAASRCGCSFDLIIDDGSHHPMHQISSFCQLFPLLSDEGVYIIEDVETSYWRQGELYGNTFNYGLADPWSSIEIFKLSADYINRKFLSDADINVVGYRLLSLGMDPNVLDTALSVQFFPNMIAVTKLATFQEEFAGDYINARLAER